MNTILYIDVETYSDVDIMESGAYKYVESPEFRILIIGYAINDNPVKIIDLARGDEMPVEFLELLTDPNCLKVAHNAVFERLCFMRYKICVPAEQWYCTSVKAAYCGLPLSLDGVSKALDIQDKKLNSGKILIRYFSCPCKPTIINGGRTRNLPEHALDKWAMYKEYNKYDVLAEREIYKRLEHIDIPENERVLYALDQKINDKGIMVDLDLAKSAVIVNEEYEQSLTERAKSLTGLDNPNSTTQLSLWIDRQTGIKPESFSKGIMENLFDTYSDNEKVIEMLKIRQSLSKTSVKKYYAMLNCAMKDHRIRGSFQFYGANRTGRWAGRLIQLQNLSKNHINDLDTARNAIKLKDSGIVEMMYGDVTDILSQLVRTAFVAPDGHLFAVADYSAIEARVISWLANEEWRMDVFNGDGKIYESTGSKMFNVPIDQIKKGSELRQKSKISELALGYGGAIGALKQMGGEKMGLTEEEMGQLVRKWRSVNPKIVRLWSDLEQAAKTAIMHNTQITCTPRNLVFDYDGEFLSLLLPSGRKLFYYKPIIENNRIKYKGVNQETKQFCYVDTYGGKLTENAVQAIARDLLGNSMLNLDAKGYTPVAHIHDEVIVEVEKDKAQTCYNEITQIMSIAPEWAKELPLRADGYLTPYYLKD